MNEGWEPEDVEDNQRTRRPTLLNEPERLRIEAAGLFHRARKAEEKNKALTTERDQLRAELIKVLRFVGGQAAPDVSTSFLLNVSEEVSMVLGEMAGETADLRAEVERLRENSAGLYVSNTQLQTRAEAAERERDEARAQAADLRGALETVLESAYPHPTEHPTMTAAWAVGNAALARTPAQSLARIKAEALRALKNIAFRKLDGHYVVFLGHIEAEATRLEAENGR